MKPRPEFKLTKLVRYNTEIAISMEEKISGAIKRKNVK